MLTGRQEGGESDMPRSNLPQLHNIIVPQLIRENKKIHVLRIKKNKLEKE